ncbi:hypothetical protein A9K75_06615 [Campylobacter fetus subsp. testudinum]|uniref:hypothetical protein n=1 Tax=Campylobacter fetus TaxID=196 RepID=UPI000818BA16|nr:hypothetical protein [Campylobacter fetus]OCR99538.1 hypothetical protein A9K75_06615 [Campylobacter fetus subsp. testudinum]
MTKKGKLGLFTLFGLVALSADVSASDTALTGTTGNFALAGDDKFGLGASFVKFSNFISDNGLNKIIGTAGGVTAAIFAYNAKYSTAIVTAVIATVGAFLPQAVDSFYGAVI